MRNAVPFEAGPLQLGGTPVRLYDYLRKFEYAVAGLLLTAVLGLTGWASVTRFLGVPNIWVIEVTQILFAWVCFLAASIALRQSQHFSMDILSSWLPSNMKPALNIVRSVLVLLILAGLIWYSIDFVEQSHRRKLPLTGIRTSWVAAALPVAFLMMALDCLDTIVRELRSKTEPEAET